MKTLLRWNPIILILIAIVSILLLYSFCRKSSEVGETINEANLDLQIVDHNQNGIWDDIEPFVDKLATALPIRLALEQYARKFQKILLDPEGEGYHYSQNSDLASKEFDCLAKVQKKYNVEIRVSEIENAIISNSARAKSYVRYNKKLSGGIYPTWNEAKQGNPCDFDF